MVRKIFIISVLLVTAPLRASADWPQDEGEIKTLKDNEYRADGKVWRCTIYDAKSGKMKGKLYYADDGAVQMLEKFDPAGHRIEQAHYDANGHLNPGIDGWAARRWFYQGQALMLQVSFDQWGKPIEKLFYSESGKLVMRLYRDDENVNPYVNAAMHMMLGGRNVAYYDQSESYDEVKRWSK